MNGFSESKTLSNKNMEMIKAGPSADSRGGSSRNYPKGSAKPGNTQSAPFNPQKQPVTDKYTGGV